ncbi:MAG: mechanosensitive ion channel domain-containing protein [Alphaproteobacteria bacterium]
MAMTGMAGAAVRAVMLAACLTLFATAPAAAQQAPAPTSTELERLVETLEDEGARAELLTQLRALIAAQRAAAPAEDAAEAGAGARLLAALSGRIAALSAELVKAVEVILEAPRFTGRLRAQLADPGGRARWITALAKILLVLAVGLAVEWLLRRALARPRAALEARGGEEWLARLPFLLARTLLELLPVAAFALAANAVLPLTEPQAVTRLAALALINANVAARALLAVARMILTPRADSLRVLPLSGETATYAYIWVRRFVTLGVYGYMLIEAAQALGLPAAGATGLVKLLGLLLAGMAVVLILQLRRPVAAGVAPADEAGGLGALRARLAETWHVLAILYILAILVVWLLDVRGGFVVLARGTVVTLVLLAAGRLATAALGTGLERVFALGPETRRRFPMLEERANRYLPTLKLAGRIVIWLVVAVGVLQAWGLDAAGWVASPAGVRVIASVVSIAIILLAATVFLELVSTAVERYLDRDLGARSARARTLLPLARNALRVAVGVVVGLMVLDELGLNIAPLLAGAGVVGLAIGFGAQTLVKDVITGVFILMEDTIAVGDVARVAGHAGIVEALSIRTIRLRDLGGTVHVIPFSEVASIENLTKDFSYAVMEVGVAYREDTDEVVEVLKEVGAELQADPEVGPNILEPLEVLGVDEFADSAVVIKIRFKTLPIKQWATKRAFNRLMKKAFDARGIEIPFPHTTLYFGEDKQGRAPPAHVAKQRPQAEPGA